MSCHRLVAALVGSCCIHTIASAVVTVRVQDVTLPSPGVSTQFFCDVFVEVTDPVPQIIGWDVVLNLTPSSSGVDLTGIFTPEGGHPHVFSGETISTDPPNRVSSDFLQATELLPAGSVALSDQSGLIRVGFTVAPGTVAVFDVQSDTLQTVLADENALPLDLLFQDGTIRVVGQATAAVPEPTGAGLAGIGVIPLIV